MAKKGKVEKDNAERWLLTYADLMNLLLIFFIILYAMSQVDENKVQQLAESLNAAFLEGRGVLPYTESDFPVQKPFDTPKSKETTKDMKKTDPEAAARLETKMMELLKEKVDAKIQQMGLNGIMTVKQQERGVQISIPSKMLFKTGSADVGKSDMDNIYQIGKLLDDLPDNQIRVEGHTDNDPINTPQFLSNWELSAARAVTVLRLLVDHKQVSENRIAATGYGAMWPVAPNDTEANKAKNRRVDIVILRNAYTKASPDKSD